MSQRRKSLAVYAAPPVPDGWHGQAPIRLIDPLGIQAAWIAPHHAGSLIAWFVRATPEDDWFQILGDRNGQPGGEVLVPDPETGMWTSAAGVASGWAFVERDPTGVTMRGLAGTRRATVSIRCDDGLHITLDAGDTDGGIGLRLRPSFSAVTIRAGEGGEARFGPGAVSGFAWKHGPHLRSSATGGEIDIVPAAHAQSPIDIELSVLAEPH